LVQLSLSTPGVYGVLAKKSLARKNWLGFIEL